MKEIRDLAVNKTYSLKMIQIARVSDLSERLGIGQSEVVRNAIDDYYSKIEQQEKIIANNE